MVWVYASLLLILAGGAFTATYIVFISKLEKRLNRPVPSRFIFLLGGRVKPDGSLSPALARRTALCAELFGRGFAQYIMASGGKGGDEPVSEAEAMSAELVRLGVPKDAVIPEDTSTNTWMNFENSAKLLEAMGLISAGQEEREDTILIVSSAYHIPRAAYIAYQQGWRNISCAGAPSKVNLLLFYRIREIFAWIKHFLTNGVIKENKQ